MYHRLRNALKRPRPFEFYTATELWADPHISQQMLKYHLDNNTELASRNCAFVDRSVAWMIDQFGIGRDTRICDLGCGPGLYTLRLARAGAAVTGVDFSDNSILYARESAASQGLAINYFHADYLEDIPDGPFDLITMIYCDFCVLSPRQRNSLLERVRNRLSPRGAFFLDVCSLHLYETTAESMSLEEHTNGGFWSDKPHYVLNKTFLYPKESLILHKHTVLQAARTREIFNWLQCYDLKSLKLEFSEAGFGIDRYFGNVAGDLWQSESQEIAVIAISSK